jgi:hypothetical protein
MLTVTRAIGDSGYQGMQKLHANTELPIKRSKNKVLTAVEKQHNKAVASKRAPNEMVIGRLKRFKIFSTRYKNRRKRFGLRFNLIAGIYNYEIMHRCAWQSAA